MRAYTTDGFCITVFLVEQGLWRSTCSESEGETKTERWTLDVDEWSRTWWLGLWVGIMKRAICRQMDTSCAWAPPALGNLLCKRGTRTVHCMCAHVFVQTDGYCCAPGRWSWRGSKDRQMDVKRACLCCTKLALEKKILTTLRADSYSVSVPPLCYCSGT